MQATIKLNLNEKVKVKLTQRGVITYNESYTCLGITNPPSLQLDEEGYATFQLWNLFARFPIRMGLSSPFVGNEIVIEGETKW